MTNTTAPPLRPFENDLLRMLARAATEAAPAGPALVDRPRPRWIRLQLVVAGTLGVVLALVVPLFSDDPLRGALAIKQRGDVLIVSVKDATADPDARTQDLRARGLPANVEVVPVSPSLEGTWVDIVNDNLAAGYNDPRLSEVFLQITKRPAELEIPADFSTPFTLVVGRPAEAGETYHISLARDVESAYECLGLAGLSPAEADSAIRQQGYEPRWYFQRSDIPQTDVIDGVPVEKVIVGAEFVGPTTVIVHTADPDGGHAPPSEDARAQC